MRKLIRNGGVDEEGEKVEEDERERKEEDNKEEKGRKIIGEKEGMEGLCWEETKRKRKLKKTAQC